MQRLIVSLISLAMTLGGFAARAAGDTKSEQLLAQARAALGGDKNLNKVQGLSAAGTYQRDMGDRQLSGKDKIPDFLTACRSTGVPGEWFDGVEIAGPLAEFEGADRCVPSPAKPGLALIGDAAASTDPSWGCGLSKTLLDVETLSACLLESDDWDAAVQRYAAKHDEHYGKLHDILSWMTELMWSGGPEADERRARVLPRMNADPTGFPDASGQGPFGPCDEQARRLILGLAL